MHQTILFSDGRNADAGELLGRIGALSNADERFVLLRSLMLLLNTTRRNGLEGVVGQIILALKKQPATKQIELLHDTVMRGGNAVERGNLLVSLRNTPEDVRKHLSTDVLAWWLCADMSNERGKCLSAIRELPVTEKLKVLGAIKWVYPELETVLGQDGVGNFRADLLKKFMARVKSL